METQQKNVTVCLGGWTHQTRWNQVPLPAGGARDQLLGWFPYCKAGKTY